MDTEPIRQDIDAIRSSMTDKMEQIESKVRGTVETTVTSVKQAFDIKAQIAERPWTSLGLSVLTGVALGSMGGSSSSSSRAMRATYPAYRGEPMRYYQEPSTGTEGSNKQPSAPSAMSASPTVPNAGHESMRVAMQGAPQGGGLLETLGEQFGDEIGALKTAAISAAMTMVRDLLRQNLPKFADEYQRAHDDRSARYEQESVSSNGESSLFERSIGTSSPTYNRSGLPAASPFQRSEDLA